MSEEDGVRNIKRSKKRLFLVAIMIIGISLSLLTMIRLKNTDENNPHNGTLLFLRYADMPPIIYDENGTAKGVTVDIAKALGKKLVIKLKSSPWIGQMRSEKWRMAKQTLCYQSIRMRNATKSMISLMNCWSPIFVIRQNGR